MKEEERSVDANEHQTWEERGRDGERNLRGWRRWGWKNNFGIRDQYAKGLKND